VSSNPLDIAREQALVEEHLGKFETRPKVKFVPDTPNMAIAIPSPYYKDEPTTVIVQEKFKQLDMPYQRNILLHELAELRLREQGVPYVEAHPKAEEFAETKGKEVGAATTSSTVEAIRALGGKEVVMASNPGLELKDLIKRLEAGEKLIATTKSGFIVEAEPLPFFEGTTRLYVDEIPPIKMAKEPHYVVRIKSPEGKRLSFAFSSKAEDAAKDFLRAMQQEVAMSSNPGNPWTPLTEGVWFGRRSDTYEEAVQRADRENRRLWEAHKALHLGAQYSTYWWVRLGDVAEYEKFDTFEEAKERVERVTGKPFEDAVWLNPYAFALGGYFGTAYINFFEGDADAQPTERHLYGKMT